MVKLQTIFFLQKKKENNKGFGWHENEEWKIELSI